MFFFYILRNPDSMESSLHKQLGMPTPKPVTARETFVKHYMADRESEFVNTETIRWVCGSSLSQGS